MTIDCANACSLILGDNGGGRGEGEVSELRRLLETGTEDERVVAMKSALHLLSLEPSPSLVSC